MSLLNVLEKREDGRGNVIELLEWNWKSLPIQYGIALTRSAKGDTNHIQFTFKTYHQARTAFHALMSAS